MLTVDSDIPELKERGVLSCIAIFWRTLDWRTYKEEVWSEKNDRWEIRDRVDWETPFAHTSNHKTASLLARRGAALWIIYQSGMGYASNVSVEQADPPESIGRLGNMSLLHHLAWIPCRYRIQFAQIFHFALAVLVARLNMDNIPFPIGVTHLKHWLVADLKSFFGEFLAGYLRQWLDEVEQRVRAGEDIFNTFDFREVSFRRSREGGIRFSKFGCETKGLFFHVGGIYIRNKGKYDMTLDDAGAAEFL